MEAYLDHHQQQPSSSIDTTHTLAQPLADTNCRCDHCDCACTASPPRHHRTFSAPDILQWTDDSPWSITSPSLPDLDRSSQMTNYTTPDDDNNDDTTTSTVLFDNDNDTNSDNNTNTDDVLLSLLSALPPLIDRLPDSPSIFSAKADHGSEDPSLESSMSVSLCSLPGGPGNLLEGIGGAFDFEERYYFLTGPLWLVPVPEGERVVVLRPEIDFW